MFVGCIEYGQPNIGPQLIDLVTSKSGLADMPYDFLDGWREREVTLIQQIQFNTANDKLSPEIADKCSSGIYIVGWVRLYNQKELAKI